MKVRDAMQTGIWVEDDLPIKNLTRIIYTANLSGFPVVHNKKLVGFITEEDIFSNLYDVKKEELHDKKTTASILEKPVKDLMVKNPISVTPDTDLIDAQRLMYKHNFTRLAVVNEKNELLGTVARADVFGQILKNEIPNLEEGQYASFVLENYDQMVDWDKRFDFEFPTLFRIFSRHNAKKVLELGIWTGEYAIGLAKEGVGEITGVDSNELMVQFANSKKAKLPQNIKSRVTFKQSDYKDLNKLFTAGSFDAAICMGGALPYIPADPESLLRQLHTIVRKDGVVVLQLLNMERVIEKRRRFLYFKIDKTKEPNDEVLYIEFFDVKDKDTLIHNVVSFVSDGNRWIYRGINSIEVKYLKTGQIEPALKAAGFKDIVLSGNKGEYKGAYGQMSLVKPFDPETSEWMTVVAYV